MIRASAGYDGYRGYVSHGVRKVADAILGRNKAPTGSPERYRDISDALLAQGTSTAPVGHWTQGAARVAQALVAREMANKANTLETKQRDEYNQIMSAAIGGDESALARLKPQDRAFLYGTQRDQVNDQRYDKEYADGRGDVAFNQNLQTDRFNHQVKTDQRDFDFLQAQTNIDNAFREGQFNHNVATDRRDYNRGVLESDRGFNLQNEQFDHRRAVDGAQLDIASQRLGMDQAEAQRKAAEATAKGTKPLISSESMARVAAGLPNMVAAVDDLETLMGPGSGFDKKGYRPGHDWGARAVNAIPDFGLLQPVAKAFGGKDYQQFENAYSKFEAAAMPIMSGSAVTDTEAERLLNSIRIRQGDGPEIVQEKLTAMRNMADGLKAAAQGDTTALNAMISGQSEPAPEIPQEAIQELVNDPAGAKEFDEIFGPGASERILGMYGAK